MLDTQLDETEDNDDLYEHHRIVVDPGQTMLRIDRFLDSKLANATRTKLQAAIDAGGIQVNGKPTKASYKVKPGDLIVLSLPHPPRETTVIPQDIPLDIVYEDNELLVVNKPAGMVVHPAHGNWDGTLVNALVYHMQNLPTGRNGEGRPGLVHRIDKDTSGLMVIAKTEYAMSHLARQFFDHSIERTYVALVWGQPDPADGTITGYIGRSAADRKVMTIYDDETKGKWSVTHYRTLEPLNFVSLVQCNLETGRTHQIRAHFRHIGHPLFNDAMYGGDRILRGSVNGSFKAFVGNAFALLPRQALHARSLGFTHPRTGERLQFDSPLPADFQAALDKWRGRMNNV
ncbi:pseudouridine synthase, RluA family [Fibrella aestuarina BUZ 2]|uniref:Pseudouridine synthase n=1 Tax=Fibrella aestuarina BUZ 2 TaxID=1166018 RepID=I0K900_9BACT|nr:RluA family pseudouridine synthase [Fibrella aestuarina]CCH00603.1 pseudouridine synthase, RluA family [Fibrella aestuarina BUZ 2]